MHRAAHLALIALALIACQPGAGTPDELAARYQAAHESQDLGALRKLVCWDRVDEVTRLSVEKQLEKELGRDIAGMRVEELSEGFELEYSLDGVTYRPNLEPVQRLRIELAPAGEGEPTLSPSMSFLVGVKNGRYLITAAAPLADDAG